MKIMANLGSGGPWENNLMIGLDGQANTFVFQDFLVMLLSYLNQGFSEGTPLLQGKSSLNLSGGDLNLSNLKEVKFPGEEPLEKEGGNNLSLFALALVYLEGLLSPEKGPVSMDGSLESQAFSLNDSQGNSLFSKDEALRALKNLLNLSGKATFEEGAIFEIKASDTTEKGVLNLKDFTSLKASFEGQKMFQGDLPRNGNILNENLRLVSEPSKSATPFRGPFETNLFESNQVLNNLSQEAREFLKTYEGVLKALSRGENPEVQINNLRAQFEGLSDVAKEELKNLMHEAKEEVKVTLFQQEATPSLEEGPIRPERVSSLFFFSKGKRLEIKEVGIDTSVRTNPLSHLQAYLKLEDLKPEPQLPSEPRNLPKVSFEAVNHFIKDFTVDLLPNGEKRALVQLEPPELGKMELEVKVEAGKVELVVKVEREETLTHLQQDLTQIRNELKDLGLELENFQLSLGLTPEGKDFAHQERKPSELGEQTPEPTGPEKMDEATLERPLYHQGRLYRIV